MISSQIFETVQESIETLTWRPDKFGEPARCLRYAFVAAAKKAEAAAFGMPIGGDIVRINNILSR